MRSSEQYASMLGGVRFGFLDFTSGFLSKERDLQNSPKHHVPSPPVIRLAKEASDFTRSPSPFQNVGVADAPAVQHDAVCLYIHVCACMHDSFPQRYMSTRCPGGKGHRQACVTYHALPYACALNIAQGHGFDKCNNLLPFHNRQPAHLKTFECAALTGVGM